MYDSRRDGEKKRYHMLFMRSEKKARRKEKK